MSGRSRTLVGFDHGERRIGVAVGQELTARARPLATLECIGRRPDWPAIARLLDEWRPDLLVVGVPRHADGSESASTLAAQAFAGELGRRFGYAVVTVDERLSSFEARERLAAGPAKARKAAIDSMAAAVIVETFLRESATSP